MMTKTDIKHLILPTLFAITVILGGCNNSFTEIGPSIRPGQDDIDVYTDTFLLDAENWMVPSISAQADTMVLGCFVSPVFGTTKADLLVQLAAPENYVFPDASFKPTPDSLVLLLYYNDYFGNPYAPLQLSIYEMNKAQIDYSTRYYSDLDVKQYCDSTSDLLLGDRTFTAIDLSRRSAIAEDSAETPYIRYKFSAEQTSNFFELIRNNPSITTKEFLKEFQGMLITTSYGTSTMAYINQITLYLYYHYTYVREGHDTIVKTSIAFPANHEVRQLNRFLHPDRKSIVENIPDSLLYIKSAAGIYPKIRIPFNRIRAKMFGKEGIDSTKKVFNISAAEVRLECIENDYTDEYTMEPAALLAISAESFDDFLKHYKSPTGYETDRVVGTYTASSNSYTFDFATLLTKALHDNTINPDSVFEFVIVPLNIEYQYSSSGTISATSVRPLVKMAGARVRSKKNPTSPLRLKLLYEAY